MPGKGIAYSTCCGWPELHALEAGSTARAALFVGRCSLAGSTPHCPQIMSIIHLYVELLRRTRTQRQMAAPAAAYPDCSSAASSPAPQTLAPSLIHGTMGCDTATSQTPTSGRRFTAQPTSQGRGPTCSCRSSHSSRAASGPEPRILASSPAQVPCRLVSCAPSAAAKAAWEALGRASALRAITCTLQPSALVIACAYP